MTGSLHVRRQDDLLTGASDGSEPPGVSQHPGVPQHPAAAEPPGAAASAVADYARAQGGAIVTTEPAVRRDDPRAVHDMRVAIRRLRSALRTFRPLWDRREADGVRTELKWLADRLGPVRDGDVMLARLTRTVDAEPPALVVGPVGERIREGLSGERAQARKKLVEALDGPRYRALLDALDALLEAPPPAEVSAAKLRKRAARSLRRADTTLEAALGADGDGSDGHGSGSDGSDGDGSGSDGSGSDGSDGDGSGSDGSIGDGSIGDGSGNDGSGGDCSSGGDGSSGGGSGGDARGPGGPGGHAVNSAALHEARKAYKRARYAAEALRPVAGKPAKRLAKRLSGLQDVLGTYQDTIVTADLLRSYGMLAHRDGDNAFTYGLLHGRQHEAGERALHELPAAIRASRRRKVRRWLPG